MSTWYDMPCTFCLAKAGEECRTTGALHRPTKAHSSRIRDWLDQPLKDPETGSHEPRRDLLATARGNTTLKPWTKVRAS